MESDELILKKPKKITAAADPRPKTRFPLQIQPA